MTNTDPSNSSSLCRKCSWQQLRNRSYRGQNRTNKSPCRNWGTNLKGMRCSTLWDRNSSELSCSACCRWEQTSAMYNHRNKCNNPQRRRFCSPWGRQCKFWWFRRGRWERGRWVGISGWISRRSREQGRSKSTLLTLCERSTRWDSWDMRSRSWSGIDRTRWYSWCRPDIRCRWRIAPDTVHKSWWSCCRSSPPCKTWCRPSFGCLRSKDKRISWRMRWLGGRYSRRRVQWGSSKRRRWRLLRNRCLRGSCRGRGPPLRRLQHRKWDWSDNCRRISSLKDLRRSRWCRSTHKNQSCYLRSTHRGRQ